MRRITYGLLGGLTLAAALPATAFAADAVPLDTGNTAWLLVAAALVMVMLPGLALFYGGLVRRKNVLSTIMHSFFGLALVSVVWVMVGFSLAFGPDVNGAGLIGDLDFVGFSNVGLEPNPAYAGSIPFVLFASFQLMFAVITVGGLGNPYGALVGSLVVGLAVELWPWVFPSAVELKNTGALIILILVLLVRPQGLLGRKERVG